MKKKYFLIIACLTILGFVGQAQPTISSIVVSGATINTSGGVAPAGLIPSCSTTPSFMVNAIGASTYSWTVTGGGTVFSPTSVSTNINLTNAITYTVTCVVTNSLSINSAPFSVIVTVSPLPMLNATQSTLCSGTSTSLSITPVPTGSINWAPSVNGTGATVATFPLTSNTTYTATISPAAPYNCVMPTLTTTITVIASPTLTIAASSNTICAGASTILTASGASTYTWNTGVVNSTNTVSPGSSTVYTVTGTNANACVNTETTTVTVNAPPTLALNFTNPPCFGLCNGSATVTVIAGNGPYTYYWPSIAITTQSANNLCPGSYSVKVTDVNNCINTSTITLTQPPQINASASAAPSVVCAGQNTVLSASATGGSGGYSYTWLAPLSGTASSIVASPTVNSTYSVSISDANGCTAAANVSITVNASPTVTVNNAISICAGANATLTASGASNYNWNTGGNTSVITVSPTVTTTYTVTGTNGACADVKTTTVTVYPTPILTVNSPTVCSGSSITIISTVTNGTAPYSYLWTG
ncbi:MAG: hypothetical protein ABI388_02830, partial [Bacteroidia bacterium]